MMAALQKCSLLVVTCLLVFVKGGNDDDNKVPVIGVSIEDFIDLDAPPAASVKDGSVVTSQTGGDDDREISAGHGDFKIAPGLGPAPPPLQVLKGDIIKPVLRHQPMTSNDEDAELSGDGSGSGDEADADSDEVTPFTKKNVTATTPKSHDRSVKMNLTLDTPPQELVVGEGGVVDESNNTIASEVNLTVSDVMYTADVWPPVPVKEQTDEGEEIPLWSPWIRTNDVTEVRIRTCSGSAEACNGTEAELRHCDSDSNRCDVNTALVLTEDELAEKTEECDDDEDDDDEDEEEEDQALEESQKPKPPRPAIDLQRTELEPCTYSLFDLKRGKYLITEWSLTRLVTQAKVKKWCSRPHEYLVFHSPHDHCRRYYRDLCHVSMRCKGRKSPPKERGDFAEGCWRQFVYGGKLPVGLSNRQTIVYLICQRYAANSDVGKTFGHKRSHFATLYDTKGRAPVVSLVKLTELGDTAWPSTPYFIEHGLVEDAEDTAWFLRKAKKGIVQLADMGKCPNEESCQLGAHQVLPSDYTATTYRTAHLLWPELAGPDPLTRTATFTMTNTAPMHAALYPAWHRAVLRVRQFAAQQCGLPHVPPGKFVSSTHHNHKHHMHHYHHHGYNGYGGQQPPPKDKGPALYLASGVIPSRDPMETIGNDINVPFMFWMAACCVADANATAGNSDTDTNNYYNNHHNHHNDYGYLFDDGAAAAAAAAGSAGDATDQRGKHYSFAIYARNTGSGSAGEAGSDAGGDGSRGQVVAAPVLQLEMLLQDIYKTMPTDANVNLFPASGGACSELKNDFSRNVRL